MLAPSEAREWIRANDSLARAYTEVALFTAVAEPCSLLEKPIYNSLSRETQATIDNFPAAGDFNPVDIFFLSLYELGIVEHDDSLPTPLKPVTVGALGHLLIQDHLQDKFDISPSQ
jgi:hypothetical protein